MCTLHCSTTGREPLVPLREESFSARLPPKPTVRRIIGEIRFSSVVQEAEISTQGGWSPPPPQPFSTQLLLLLQPNKPLVLEKANHLIAVPLISYFYRTCICFCYRLHIHCPVNANDSPSTVRIIGESGSLRLFSKHR